MPNRRGPAGVGTIDRSRRRLVGAGLLLAAGARPARAAARPAHVGYLELVGASDGEELFRAFVEGMRGAGYADGRDLRITRRSAGGRSERLRDLAAGMAAGKADVVLAASTESARAAKHAAPKVPTVFVVGGDPVFEGLVASLARPQGNLTGVATRGADLTGKQLEILKEGFPATRTVAVVGSNLSLSRLSIDESARALQLAVLTFPVHAYGDYREAAYGIARSEADAVLVAEDADAIVSLHAFARLMMATRRPVMFNSDLFAENFGLMSFGVDLRERYRRAAGVVARVLAGAKPAQTAVELPSRYELVVNLRAADEYAIAVPREFLLRADRVIQ